jgi:DNA polymerase elongation subunit (family B)
MCGCNLNDTFGTIKKLDALTYNFVSDRGLVIPPTKHEDGETFPGGYVAEPQVGRHYGLVSVDASSLYPSMIRMFNISPETHVHFEDLPNEIQDLCLSMDNEKFLRGEIDTSCLKGTPYTITVAGVVYDQSKKGIVPMIMESLFFGRKADKKKSLEHKMNYLKAKESGGDQAYINQEYVNYVIHHNRQISSKTILNSFFGSYGNANFRYYSLDHAKSITLSGQLGIRYVSQEINKWLKTKLDASIDYISYGDTDSIYLTLGVLFKKFNIDPLDPEQYDKARELLTKFTDGPLQVEINRITQEWSDMMNCKENILDMEREAISVRGGIFVAKKKYALMVDDLEGVKYTRDKPYMKIMGLEIAKAGKYSVRIRDWLEELLTIILNESETAAQNKIAEWNKIFNSLPLEEIGVLTGVNDVDKWLETNGTFKSGAPIGPKALVNHNNFLDRRGDYSVERLNAGEKILYVPMRKGNPAGADTMGFVTWTGSLLELDSWVDRVTLWNKNFISPAEIMLKAVGWSSVKKNKLF